MHSTFADAALAALEALDTDRLVACYADEFLFEDQSAGATITSRIDLRNYFVRLFSLPAVGFAVTATAYFGEGGSAEWIWTGRKESGESYTVRGASIFEFDKHGITREAIYYDPAPTTD